MASPLSAEDLRHVLEYTKKLWKELNGARFFITGGTGFFGRWLLESLFAANRQFDLGLELVVLTRNPDSFRKQMPHLSGEPLILHQGDVRSFDFPAGSFTHLIHAGTMLGMPVEPLEMFETIVQGTRRTLDFALAGGVHSFLLISSGAVYGRQQEGTDLIPETFSGSPDTSLPSSAYAEGKRSAEMLCTLYHQKHGLAVKTARCFAFIGPHLPLDAHFAVGNFIRDAMQGGPIHVKGDGTSMRSYLYSTDLIIWLLKILIKGSPCRPYNVGSDKAVTIRQLAETVRDVINPAGKVLFKKTVSSRGDFSFYVPSTARAAAELDLKIRVSLPGALERTAAWLRNRSL